MIKSKTIMCYVCFLLLFVASLAFGASNKSSGVNSKANNRERNDINFTDAQKPIVVKRNHPTFTIILQSNPTTGFSWTLKEYNSLLIKPISRAYFPSTKRGLMGAGGYEKWIFAVKPVGFTVPQTTSVTLIYSRPWELQGAQATNFKVVTVP